MAVEDELRGGPIIEPKTRIFADQVCETASSLVESVRWPVLSSLPPSTPLSPPCYSYNFVCCVYVVPLNLSCPVPDRSLCLGLTAVCLPTYLGALTIKVCRCLHSLAQAIEMSDSSWVCERLSVCDDDVASSIVVSVEHVGG